MPILYSQKVNVSIDEFTDKKIIYTTWETLSINIASGEWYYRFYSQDGLNVLEIRFMTSNMDVRMVEAGTSIRESTTIRLKTIRKSRTAKQEGGGI